MIKLIDIYPRLNGYRSWNSTNYWWICLNNLWVDCRVKNEQPSSVVSCDRSSRLIRKSCDEYARNTNKIVCIGIGVIIGGNSATIPVNGKFWRKHTTSGVELSVDMPRPIAAATENSTGPISCQDMWQKLLNDCPLNRSNIQFNHYWSMKTTPLVAILKIILYSLYNKFWLF